MTTSVHEAAHITEYRRKIQQFAQDELAQLAPDDDRRGAFSPPLLEQMGRLGLFGCQVPQEYGGYGHDELSYLAAVEELARVDGAYAAIVASHNSLGIGSIMQFGSTAQHQRYVPDLCTGKQLWGFALTEQQSGSDIKNTTTTAAYAARDASWILNGHKHWITNTATPLCAGVTVMARRAEHPQHSCCLLVPSATPGFQQTPMPNKLMWRATATGELTFDDVRLAGEQRLGDPQRGMQQMLTVLNSGRLSIAAMGLGLARGAYECARQHAISRRTFGRALIDHQAVAFKLAEMKTKIAAAASLLATAAKLKSAQASFRIEAAMAKLFATEVAEFCAREGLQIVAGQGLFHPHPMERFYRDATILRIGEGTSEIQKLIISRHLKDTA